jgi:hypothetical protein
MNRCFVAITLCLFTASQIFADAQSVLGVGASMTKAANAFIADLDDAAKAKAMMAFDDPARMDWHNIPKPERKGLQFRDMTTGQRDLCYELLKSSLSETGYQKAINVMALESNLKEGEKDLKDSPLRDPQRYFLTIFGTPSAKGTWGWSFEGHHLSLNFVIVDSAVVSDTPSFWGSNPATVKVYVEGGPQVGTRNLADEEQLAFDLVNALDKEQQKVAIIAETAPAEYRNAGNPLPPSGAPEGIQAAKMNESQKKLLNELLEVYCNHLAPAIANQNLERIKLEGIDRIHFAWAGSIEPGVGHYYRVQGPSFLLEFVNIQSDPQGNKANHIHSVWRNLNGDFGKTLSSQ